jgi:hypothetical protein
MYFGCWFLSKVRGDVWRLDVTVILVVQPVV